MMGTRDETEDIHASEGAPAHAPHLVISSSSGVRTVPVPSVPRFTIGRSATCDVVIDDDSVSREHAAVHVDGTELHIEDLGSRNKTRVGGKAIRTRTKLMPGSVVEIGHASMFLHFGVAAPGPDRALRASSAPAKPAGAIIVDPTMARLYALLDLIAPSPLHVLVLGETGTGKEIFAETIHMRSSRAAKPFLKINCATLTGSLLESELFGHEKGAFTGAAGAKPGLFESADGGTVFLDEIAELPLDTQAKLLRVIEYGEVHRLGAVRPRSIDVRYIGATNAELASACASGKFRTDLYFRLNGFSATLPPLRARPSEIVPLARHFLAKAGGADVELSAEAVTALERHSWPGNIRELKMVVQRALVLATGGRVEAAHLQLAPASGTPSSAGRASLPSSPEEGVERDRIVAALEQTHGNQTAAAKLLGIARRTLINRIEQYGIGRPRKG